jgi:16S rRNA (guanine1516-N2)-methyltransferase
MPYLVHCTVAAEQSSAKDLQTQLDALPNDETTQHVLWNEHGITLHDPQQILSDCHISYVRGSMAHRVRQNAGLEPLAKAVRLKQLPASTIHDWTAGFGFDGYRMASFGHEVVLFEQHPLLALMAQHALHEAQHSFHIVCHQGPAQHWQQYETVAPDVIYLDPMFPERHHSAAVNHRAQWLQRLTRSFSNQPDNLIQQALYTATRRVVVKRPKQSKPYLQQQLVGCITGKRCVFDLYCPIKKT